MAQSFGYLNDIVGTDWGLLATLSWFTAFFFVGSHVRVGSVNQRVAGVKQLGDGIEKKCVRVHMYHLLKRFLIGLGCDSITSWIRIRA